MRPLIWGLVIAAVAVGGFCLYRRLRKPSGVLLPSNQPEQHYGQVSVGMDGSSGLAVGNSGLTQRPAALTALGMVPPTVAFRG